MISKEFLKDCTRINNKNKSLGFGYSEIGEHPNKMLICIGNRHLGKTFFCTISEKENNGSDITYNLSLLKNDNQSTEEYIGNYCNSQEIRKVLIDIIKEIYPLEENEKSKEYCYPRKNISVHNG